MAKIPSSDISDLADVAQRAMPGWHAVMLPDKNSGPVLDALPGRSLAQLQAKFLGTRLRSAQHELHASKVDATSEPTGFIRMARNNPGKGPKEMVVLVSGKKVVAFQG